MHVLGFSKVVCDFSSPQSPALSSQALSRSPSPSSPSLIISSLSSLFSSAPSVAFNLLTALTRPPPMGQWPLSSCGCGLGITIFNQPFQQLGKLSVIL